MKSKRLVFIYSFVLSVNLCFGQAKDCSVSKITWVNDPKIMGCKFIPPVINSDKIKKIEFGNKIDLKSPSYHCYYVENKVCSTNDCKGCTVKAVYDLMLTDKQFIAPTDENGLVSDCGTTLVNIPPSFANPYNPIVTTLHANFFSIVNYTVNIDRGGMLLNTGHALHPGKVQRTIIKRGSDIFICTMGEGTGLFSSINEKLAPGIWNKVDAKLTQAFERKCSSSGAATLFLFDVSGSMADNNKWQDAKQSAITTLKSIRAQSQSANLNSSVSIRSFDGDCTADPTKEVINFTSDITKAEAAMAGKIPPPGGGTPLPQALKISEDKLQRFLNANGIKKGKLVVLTDGESSCGPMRPAGVYASGQPLQPASFNAGSAAAPIKIYAIGFGIAPGSAAERDLQYIAQNSGGKYLNAQNQVELTFAFQKFNRMFIPKSSPANPGVANIYKESFDNGLAALAEEDFDGALIAFKQFNKNNPTDFNGVYNLALTSEANDLYKAAIKNYALYLQLNPNASDKIFVTDIIIGLTATAKRYAEYNKQVVKSDLAYLDAYFKKIQNGESVALASEFIGFIREKYSYYQNLATIVEVDDRAFKVTANEVFKGLKECADTIYRNPAAWDRDATPVLSRTYLNMERLMEVF